MTGYILLSDGLRLDGPLRGAAKTAMGYLVVNTGVVGFQEMATDPAYKGGILALTYPEICNVGVTEAFAESPQIQPAAMVVKVLSETESHYLAEGSLDGALSKAGVPCLTGIDTRALAVHLREKGEMPAAVAPADADPDDLAKKLSALARPEYEPSEAVDIGDGKTQPTVAVINLGVRRSLLEQLARHARVQVFAHDASAKDILSAKPAGEVVSDGPFDALPPQKTVEMLGELLGALPVLGCGLGHVALGAALGCEPIRLSKGHHGANYPVRNSQSGKVVLTQQRHTTVLDRQSVETSKLAQLTWQNIQDGSVEGIATEDGRAVGFQDMLAAPAPGATNPHLEEFIRRCLAE